MVRVNNLYFIGREHFVYFYQVFDNPFGGAIPPFTVIIRAKPAGVGTSAACFIINLAVFKLIHILVQYTVRIYLLLVKFHMRAGSIPDANARRIFPDKTVNLFKRPFPLR
jgi:hypothetical protein